MAKRTPPKRTPKKTDAQIIEAIEASRGFVAQASRMLGMSRAYLHERIRKSEKLTAAVASQRESNLDLGEGQLMKAVEAGESWGVCFLLKCLGKSRGYIERQQIEMDAKVEQSGSVQIYIPDNKRDDKPISDVEDPTQ